MEALQLEFKARARQRVPQLQTEDPSPLPPPHKEQNTLAGAISKATISDFRRENVLTDGRSSVGARPCWVLRMREVLLGFL